MSESKHTPGPWTLDGPVGFADPDRGAMVYAPHGNGHLVATIEYQYAESNRANARLIAAAPDLLAVCKWILEPDDPIGSNAEFKHLATEKACAAIAKVEQG